MMNYGSAVNVLTRAGYRITNKCHFNGETYHDFSSKSRTSVSLVVDEIAGAVSRAEVTRMKWDDKAGRYTPVKETITGLQTLIDTFAPRKPMSI